MMDFRLSEDQEQFQQTARAFIQNEMAQLAREIEESSEPLSDQWLRRLGLMGFLGINISSDLGGLGLGNLEALLVIEEFAKLHPAVAFPIFESCVGPVRAIERFGSDSIKRSVIPAVCRGELVVAVAMSEPDAGTALTDLKTSARIEGDEVVLNGTKRWCSGGGHSGGYLVYCRLEDVPGAKGIGAVYVEKKRAGVSFGAREQFMGFRGVYTSDIFLDEVRVPREHIVVPAGGFAKLMEAFDLERCGNATMCLGIASSALEEVTAYTQERKQFGKSLIEFQAVQLKLAEMAMQVEASRLLIYKAATSAAAGFPSVLDSSLAKCFANEMVRDVCGKALQLMGAYGYSKQYGMERRLRDAWGWGIAGGAIDIQKVNIAAALAKRRFSQRNSANP
jgi:alkylation response protein AidB-like acyl-CoA dehydrogenase